MSTPCSRRATAWGAAELAAARARLLSGGPAPGRLDAVGLRQQLGMLFEGWLIARAAELGISVDSGLAVVATGGLARRQLLPFSDLDVLLLHRDCDAQRLAEVAEGLWYPLWDAHVALDHSVRTEPEALQVAADDLTTALGLLEAHHVAGDAAASEHLVAAVRQQWRTGIAERFPALVQQAQARWDRYGEIAQSAEPDLEQGHGGLRDVQLLHALATAHLTDAARDGRLLQAHRHVVDVRTQLQWVAGRADDRLRAQDADEVAAALGVGDRFALAGSVSAAARVISAAVDSGLRTASAALPRRHPVAGPRRRPLRRPLAEGVVEQIGEAMLALAAQPQRDPGLPLRLAAAAVRAGLPMSAAALTQLAQAGPPLPQPWPRQALADLLVVLGSGRSAVEAVAALDRHGLWGRWFPEWEVVRDLPPRDAVHAWTVDRHLLETVAYAGALTTTVGRPDLLLLGALLHDLGKGRGGDHSVVGAALAAEIGPRLGLSLADTRILTAVVRHHLLLPHTAIRRDLADPATIHMVVASVDGDARVLELLLALAEADSRATGPGVWGQWKATLLGELVARCGAVMAGVAVAAPQRVPAEVLPAAAAGGVTVQVGSGEAGVPVVTVVAPADPGLFGAAAGVLALHSLRVVSARLTAVVDAAGALVTMATFMVLPTFGAPPDAGLLRQDVIRALAADLDPLAVLGSPVARSAAWPQARPRLLWFDSDSADGVVLEVRAADRTGLLCRLARALAEVGAVVHWARVDTLGAVVVDVFCLDIGDCDRDRVAAAVWEQLPHPA